MILAYNVILAGAALAFQSPTEIVVDEFNKPIPLVCLATSHQSATYKWSMLGRTSSFPSTPVLFVCKVDLYSCSVMVGTVSTDSLLMSLAVRPGISACNLYYSLCMNIIVPV